MEDVFSPGPAPAAGHLFQQLVVNLPKNVSEPDTIGILSCSGWRGRVNLSLQKTQKQKLKQ